MDRCTQRWTGGGTRPWQVSPFSERSPEGTVTSSGNSDDDLATHVAAHQLGVGGTHLFHVERVGARDSQVHRAAVNESRDCCNVGDLSVAPACKSRATQGNRGSWNESPHALSRDAEAVGQRRVATEAVDKGCDG